MVCAQKFSFHFSVTQVHPEAIAAKDNCMPCKCSSWSSCCGTAKRNPTSNHELVVRSPASLSGLRIRCCHELWCRLQTRLGSCIAVAVAEAGSCGFDSTPSLGTSTCPGWGPKNKQTNKQKNSFSHFFRLLPLPKHFSYLLSGKLFTSYFKIYLSGSLLQLIINMRVNHI